MFDAEGPVDARRRHRVDPGLRINIVSPALLVESAAMLGEYFRGHDSVPASRVANAYVKSVEGHLTGQVFEVG